LFYISKISNLIVKDEITENEEEVKENHSVSVIILIFKMISTGVDCN